MAAKSQEQGKLEIEDRWKCTAQNKICMSNTFRYASGSQPYCLLFVVA